VCQAEEYEVLSEKVQGREAWANHQVFPNWGRNIMHVIIVFSYEVASTYLIEKTTLRCALSHLSPSVRNAHLQGLKKNN
jgi:hypothetical protein